MVNIKVAVRIRPLSQREVLNGEEIIARKEDRSVLVSNPKIPERQDGDSRQRTRRFTVDFCYDSRDPESCTQELVYNEIGSEVLHSMYEGYNACVLAYGPSASGKTYTIMGLQNDPGLTPRLCEGLFEKLMKNLSAGRIRTEVVISFLEIYNEKVRDLLGGEESGGSCGNFSLRVREHPKLGPYVQGLSEHLVKDKKKLLELLATGNKRRSTAETENNIHSSRSHAVFTIRFKRSDGGDFEAEKSSKVHMVDLAGSERASASQSRARLQEGANINKSLVTLGSVISALAESLETGIASREHSDSKSCHPFVPYRDSVLTWLLKDTLGGNSNTIMIATISPAGSCLKETVNTLRYAKRTKKIVNRPIMNEDPKVRTIRELRKEIARLKGLLLFFQPREGEANSADFGQNIWEELSLESKWPEPKGKEVTNKEENLDKEKNRRTRKEMEGGEREDEKKGEQPPPEPRQETLEEGGGGMREICDEKESCVNGSVNDNFSHEAQIFSDSLENFSSGFFKKENLCAGEEDALSGGGRREAKRPNPTRESLSREKDFPEVLHRSRPDLIKGISTRSKESRLFGSSQSCTDVSNLSQSTSENSLNSSGSNDALPSGNRSIRHTGRNEGDLSESKAEKGNRGKEVLRKALKKKDKRSEVVEAVTSRLYGAKKQDSKATGKKKAEEEEDDDGDDGELEQLQLCKRARMKLFDLRRKLALAKKMKKTVDNDTQTDCMPRTVRMKEKCVTTEVSGTGEENPDEEKKKKPYMIMNQVFIPRSSSYVVECGRVVRIEAPEAADRRESATQTFSEPVGHKNVLDSPLKISFREEDYFSDDSLDLEANSRSREERFSEETGEAENDRGRKRDRLAKFKLLSAFEREFGGEVEAKHETDFEKLDGAPFNEMQFRLLRKRGVRGEERNILDTKEEENESSENSCTSTEDAEMNSLSETSSEDFVFYESPKGNGSSNAVRGASDRELYTITENSEQSDPGDGLGTIKNQGLWMKLTDEKKMGHSGEENSSGCSRANGSKIKFETFAGSKTQESTDSTKWYSRKVSSKESKAKSSPEHSLKAVHVFPRTFQSKEIPKEVSNGRRPASSSATRLVTERTIGAHLPKGEEADGIEASYLSEKTKLRDGASDEVDFQLNCHKQYVNLNIIRGSGNGSGMDGATPFSVDTHLFENPSKNKNTEAMSASADSITFVFMGPAKAKTSVLMEIINRSLGRDYISFDISSGQRQSRSRGVQCGTSLMRSVSVDTAMIALSRIAKNQEPPPKIPRTTSLGSLNSCGAFEVSGGRKPQNRRKRSCQSEIGTEHFESEMEKFRSKHSVGASAALDGDTRHKKTETEKQKKSVSWFGDSQDVDGREESEGSDFRLEHQKDEEEQNADEFSSTATETNIAERRVRFVKAEGKDPGELGAMSSDNLRAFLKEVTQLLNDINSRSQRYLGSSEDKSAGWDADSPGKKEDNRKSALKTTKRPESMTKSRKENCVQKEIAWKTKMVPAAESKGINADENRTSLTWPRRRPTTGKPPTGTKTKFSRFPLPAHFDSLHFCGFPNYASNPTTWSQSSRTGSSGYPWNFSSLSAALSNSCFGETQNGLPSSRNLLRDPDLLEDFCSAPGTATKFPDVQKLNFHSLRELEMGLEECCRRLEMTAEGDEMRQKFSEINKKEKENKEPSSVWPGAGGTGRELWFESEKPKSAIKRRKTERCAGGCTCGRSRTEPCRHLWSNGCRSSFELDSFGPGSSHCYQLCMFCRKKETETYYSVLNLNSQCFSGLCRLKHYGFCPCSPVRISQVSPSPRAYMQHLLAMRKRIVGGPEQPQLESQHARQDFRGFCGRGRLSKKAFLELI